MTQTVLLGDIKIKDLPLQIIDGDRGSNYPKGHQLLQAGHCLFLSAKNVTTDGFNFSETQFVDEETDAKLRKGKLQRFDIVLTTRGTVGNVAFYDENIPFENIRINSGMVLIRCDEKKLLPQYFYYILNSKLFLDQVLNFSSGSAQPQLPIRDIQNIRLPLPSIEEQREVIDQIGSIESKIKVNRRINETLEKIGQALFKHYFIDNPEAKTWPRGKLSDVIDKINGQLKPGIELTGRIYLPVDRLQMHSLSILDPLPPEEAKSSLIGFEKDDVLLGAMRVYFHRVNIAPQKGVTRTTTFVLRAKDEKLRAYSTLLLYQDKTIAYANTHSKGTTMPYAVWDNGLANMPITIPPHEELKKYNDVVLPILEKIRDSFKDAQTLAKLRDSLLPRLISGKIKV